MRLSIFTASVVLTCLLSSPVRAQSSATLDISDVDLFYRLYDATDGRPTAEQIQSGYIDVGSPGLRTFFDARRTTAVRVAEAIVSRPEIYRQARACSSVLPQVKGQVDAALAKLVSLYPEARLPSVTLAVGRGRPVAIGSSVTGIQVGLEALCATDFIEADIESRFVGVLVHEYVHAQPNPGLTEKTDLTVLETALLEGGAEFVTEVLIGRPAYTYFGPLVRGREHEIEVAFSADMDKTDLSEWFYNSTKDKPSDIGYWVGYRIAKSYYEKAPDKTAALKNILEFSDAQAFLAASGWRLGVGSTE
ncbi:lytic murein transglycosylase [Brevundimonas sp. MYb46]|uniref:DUF2268 domain-containing putative Zn-dependent protease n=2 Tax=unclassified Brevundimonas TaxID=2622653 RepID=UPI000CFE8D3A|nr:MULTISPECIES: DUF2268 domain-containing putative Zn-dependent protease [unclassified Brevundimonas]PRB17986.1 lytic murein transglycosylase [Brevundimonas sp. MYb52]PRB35966.1 lytic murein transglycosylase [Brevundimonas sp. MYb46]